MPNLPILSNDNYTILSVWDLYHVHGKKIKEIAYELKLSEKEVYRALRKFNRKIKKQGEEYLSNEVNSFATEFIERHRARLARLWQIVYKKADPAHGVVIDSKEVLLAIKLLKEEDEGIAKLLEKMNVLPKAPPEEEKPVEVSWLGDDDGDKGKDKS